MEEFRYLGRHTYQCQKLCVKNSTGDQTCAWDMVVLKRQMLNRCDALPFVGVLTTVISTCGVGKLMVCLV